MANIYISPNGSGNKSGADAGNAMALTAMNAAVKAAGAGGQVLMLADQGVYEVKDYIAIGAGGTADAPVTIRGISSSGATMDAVFNGSRATEFSEGAANGNTFFRFQPGADNIVLSNIDVQNAKTAFLVVGDIKNLTIQNVDAQNVYRFFEDYAAHGNKTATIDGLTIRNVTVDGFEKGVIRLQYDTSNVVIDNVHGDAGGQVDDFFAIGVHLEGTVHDVLIRNSSMANVQNFDSSYQNGDGFATERGVYSVRIEDTRSVGSTDAGFDLKSTDTTLVRTYAGDNAKNYKLWGEVTLIDPIGVDPHVRGGTAGQNQMYVLAGASVKLTGGTFVDSGSKTVVFSVRGDLDVLEAPSVLMGDGARYVVGTMPDGLVHLQPELAAITGLFSSLTPVAPLPDVPASDGPPPLPADDVAIPVVPAVPPVVDVAPAPPVVAPVEIVAPAPAPTPVPAPAAAVTPLAEPARHWMEVGSDSLVATAKQDALLIDMDAAVGKMSFTGFAANDIIVTNRQFADGNRDGIIQFGADKMLGWDHGAIDLGRATTSLRYLGVTEDGHAYASAKTKLKGWIEGTTADDALRGDAKGVVKDVFFFDNALHLGVGDDRVAGMKGDDRIVLTEALDADAAGVVRAVDGAFDLTRGVAGDSVTVAGVDALHFAGTTVANGTIYYHYAALDEVLI